VVCLRVVADCSQASAKEWRVTVEAHGLGECVLYLPVEPGGAQYISYGAAPATDELPLSTDKPSSVEFELE
jgi:hypothetical protein